MSATGHFSASNCRQYLDQRSVSLYLSKDDKVSIWPVYLEQALTTHQKTTKSVLASLQLVTTGNTDGARSVPISKNRLWRHHGADYDVITGQIDLDLKCKLGQGHRKWRHTQGRSLQLQVVAILFLWRPSWFFCIVMLHSFSLLSASSTGSPVSSVWARHLPPC